MNININFKGQRHSNIETDKNQSHDKQHHFRFDLSKHNYFIRRDDLDNNTSVSFTNQRHRNIYAHPGDVGNTFVYFNCNQDVGIIRFDEADAPLLQAQPVKCNFEQVEYVEAMADWHAGRLVPYWAKKTDMPENFQEEWVPLHGWSSMQLDSWIKRYDEFKPLKALLASDAVAFDQELDFPLDLTVTVSDVDNPARSRMFGRGYRPSRRAGASVNSVQWAYKLKSDDVIRPTSESSLTASLHYNPVAELSPENPMVWPATVEWIASKRGSDIIFYMDPAAYPKINDLISALLPEDRINIIDVSLSKFADSLEKLMSQNKPIDVNSRGGLIENVVSDWDEFKNIPKDKVTFMFCNGELVASSLSDRPGSIYSACFGLTNLLRKDKELMDKLTVGARAYVETNACSRYLGCDDDIEF